MIISRGIIDMHQDITVQHSEAEKELWYPSHTNIT